MSLAYRPDVDGLRAIAVGSVVLFHAGFGVFKGGFVGVDVFFVISGFLITSIIADDMGRGRFSLMDFYDRRVRRILPALLLVLAGTTAIGAFILLPGQMQDLARTLIPATLFYANVHFMGLESYFAPAAEELPLLHLWSLAVEEQFYIVFPLLLFALLRLGGRRLALGVLAAVALGSLAYAQIELEDAPRRAFFLLSARAWELLTGAFLALAPLPKVRPAVAAGLGALGLGALLVPVFAYDRSTPFPGLAALPPVLGAALIIYSGRFAAAGPVARLLALPGMVYVGRISYSLYLWHWPLLSLAFIYRGRALTPLLAAALIALAVALSALSLRFVETPLRRPGLLGGRPAARLAVGAGALCVAVLGALGLDRIEGRIWPLSPRGVLAEAAMREGHGMTICTTTADFMPGTASCATAPPGAEGDPAVLVWGDSHARASFQGFAELAAAEGAGSRLLTLSGCPPLLGVEAPRFGDEGADCASFNAAVLGEIARVRPRLVVLVGRWALWTTHARRNVALTMADLPAAREPSAEGSRAAFPVALRRTVEEIRKLGVNVLVVGQVPEYLNPPAGCVARAEYFGGDATGCMTQPLAEKDRVIGSTDAAIRQVARDVPGTGVALLSDLFCDARDCRAGSAAAFFYSDGNHLSLSGARLLRDDPGLRATMGGLLRAPAARLDAPAEHEPGAAAGQNAQRSSAERPSN
ncbi:acyltransferase family protein [Xanthobacter sp. V4C-4]|uniref:acyltransferase family protein n=1 Tax=Xanthobacter cornucopiae TaxID=3119924 RepID=UPI0037294A46